MWGVATAAYQIEGATEVDNRGSSIWDEFSKLPGKVANNDNADVADLSYYKYMDDIHLMKSLNVKVHRDVKLPILLECSKSISFSTQMYSIIDSPYRGAEFFLLEKESSMPLVFSTTTP